MLERYHAADVLGPITYISVIRVLRFPTCGNLLYEYIPTPRDTRFYGLLVAHRSQRRVSFFRSTRTTRQYCGNAFIVLRNMSHDRSLSAAHHVYQAQHVVVQLAVISPVAKRKKSLLSCEVPVRVRFSCSSYLLLKLTFFNIFIKYFEVRFTWIEKSTPTPW